MKLTTEIIESANLSKRQYRLFAVACCNRIRHLITDQRSLNAVDTVEKYADGKATIEELQLAESESYIAAVYNIHSIADGIAHSIVSSINITDIINNVIYISKEEEYLYQLLQDFIQSAVLIKLEINENIWQIANQIYESKRFEDLPVLADAMEENGCDNRILEHFRSGRPHVRGCWAIDLIINSNPLL